MTSLRASKAINIFLFLRLMSIKQNISGVLRKTGLLGISDKLRYQWQKLRHAGANRNFIKNNPAIVFPPPYFIYETYRLNYEEYYNDGYATAKELTDLIKANVVLTANSRVLDWGCGPARITRHLPSLLPGAAIYGTDYNPKYIDWCKTNIPGIEFHLNKIEPPFRYENDFFDAVIGLSIFTHLSIKGHTEWITELYRVLKKGGILIITTQGAAYRDKLLKEEQSQFDKNEIVVRENFKQGHRLYSSYQPQEAIVEMIKNKFQLLEYMEGDKAGLQDMWVLKKQ
jgi:SAM-dependent methyltransferase